MKALKSVDTSGNTHLTTEHIQNAYNDQQFPNMIFEFQHDFTPICWKDNYLKAQQGTDNIGSKCVRMANLTFAVNTRHNGNLISATSHIRNEQVLE